MKKVMYTLVFLLTLAAFAQNGDRPDKKDRDPQEMAQERSQELATELSLDDSQAKKVKILLLDEITLMKENRDNKEKTQGMSKEKKTAMRESRMAMRDVHDFEMKKILTAEQYDKYTTMPKRKDLNAKRDGKKKESDSNGK